MKSFILGIVVGLLFSAIGVFAADTPIKGNPTYRVPSGFDFSKSKFTIDVPVNDQNGLYVWMESVALDLEDRQILNSLTQNQLDKLTDVAKIIYKLSNRIN